MAVPRTGSLNHVNYKAPLHKIKAYFHVSPLTKYSKLYDYKSKFLFTAFSCTLFSSSLYFPSSSWVMATPYLKSHKILYRASPWSKLTTEVLSFQFHVVSSKISLRILAKWPSLLLCNLINIITDINFHSYFSLFFLTS